MKKVFIWSAHPKANSLSEGLAKAYGVGVTEGGGIVRRMDLSEMSFDHSAFRSYGKDMPELEPDLLTFQRNLTWADHIVIVHPIWWGSMPAQAKAVLDRTLLPDFAFKFQTKLKWNKLLAGRTADVILTSDSPPILDTLLYLASWRRVIKNQILGFCGIQTRKITQLGPVRGASSKQIDKWLNKVKGWGTKVASRGSRDRSGQGVSHSALT